MSLDPVLLQFLPLDPVQEEFLQSKSGVNPAPADWPAIRKAAKAMLPAIRGTEAVDVVASVDDLQIKGPGGPIFIRIYRPTTPTTTTLVYFHGGGWVMGDLDSVDHTIRRICATLPAVVVSVTYRLAPEHPFPAPFEDALAGIRWAIEHVDALGGDPERIVIAGDSAGANLGAAVAMALRDDARARSGHLQARSSLQAQLLLYPATDLRGSAWQFPSRMSLSDPTLSADMLRECLNAYAGNADLADTRISPAAAEDLTGLPPALVVAIEVDPLRDEAIAYGRAMGEAGVRTQVMLIDGMTHGFAHFARVVPRAKEEFDRVIGAFRNFIAR